MQTGACAAVVLGLNNNFGGVPALDILDVNLSPISSIELASSGRAYKAASVENVQLDTNMNGRIEVSEIFDLAFVSVNKSIVIVNVTTPAKPEIVAEIPMPAVIRVIEVDVDKMRLYASGQGVAAGSGEAFYVVDVSNPNIVDPFSSKGLKDLNGDTIDDRIIKREGYGIDSIGGLRVDTERNRLYVGVSSTGGGRLDVYDLGQKNFSGYITYTRYKAVYDKSIGEASGLDYTAPSRPPVRGAVVELRKWDGTLIKTTNTSETGYFGFDVPPNSLVYLVVRAELGDPANPHLKVVNNTQPVAGSAPASPEYVLYKKELKLEWIGTAPVTANYNIDAEWDSSAGDYKSRDAAPFSILDTVYNAEQFVRRADPALSLPLLKIYWSDSNKEGAQKYLRQNIMYLDGLNSESTDEYDPHVITHEWAHYLLGTIRDDTQGGAHTIAVLLEDRKRTVINPSLAFSEGFAHAFAAMALGDPIFMNTKSVEQQSVSVWQLEVDEVLDWSLAEGGYHSEVSVGQLIYDIFDGTGSECDYDVIVPGNACVGPTVNDGVELGFKPIYSTLKKLENAPSFINIFTFLKYLIDGEPSSRDEIVALAGREHIYFEDNNSFDGQASHSYTDASNSFTREFFQRIYNPIYVQSGPLPASYTTTFQVGHLQGQPLATREEYSRISGDRLPNKLYNLIYFRFSAPDTGKYHVEVVPTGAVNNDIYFMLKEGKNEVYVDGKNAGLAEEVFRNLAKGDYSLAVGGWGGPSEFKVRVCKDLCQ